MKKILFLLLFPLLCSSQIEKTIKFKVAMMQNCFEKGTEGETFFWQTKGKITYAIVNYTTEQNPVFKQLFINQYQEIMPVFIRMNKTEQEADTTLFIKILIQQETDYRKLLTANQLKLYLLKLADLEKNNPAEFDSYTALFFSEKLLNEFKARF